MPTAYRIEVAPNLQTLAFTGSERIDLDVQAATTTIVLDKARTVRFAYPSPVLRGACSPASTNRRSRG